jgi:hypothetical protein
MNFDVRSRRQVTIPPWQIAPYISVLRVLFRNAAVTEFSIVAFSMEDQKILFRQDYSNEIDFQGLGKGIKSLSPATVNFSELGRSREKEFLGDLVGAELGGDNLADAVVFIGTDQLFGWKVPKEELAVLEAQRGAIHFLNIQRYPWRGVLGNIVKSMDGKEYRIRRPRELSEAVSELVETILARREGEGD